MVVFFVELQFDIGKYIAGLVMKQLRIFTVDRKTVGRFMKLIKRGVDMHIDRYNVAFVCEHVALNAYALCVNGAS